MEQTVHIVHFLSILPLILLSFHIVNNFKKKYLLTTLILIFLSILISMFFLGIKSLTIELTVKSLLNLKT